MGKFIKTEMAEAIKLTEMEKATILIIDDDPIQRKILTAILTAKGYATLGAGSGAEGLALLQSHAVALALVDLGLPDIPGLEVLSAITADHPATAAIILTGNATLETAIEATNRGAFSYQVKPYDVEQLLLAIRRGIEKQQADEALRRSEARFRNLLEAAPHGILITDTHHEILMVNRQFETMFGYNRAEVVGKKVEMLIPSRFAQHRDLGREYMQKPEMRAMGRGRDLFALRKDGSELSVEIGLSPLQTPDGLVVFATVIDISERKRAEAERRRAEEALAHSRSMLAYILNSVPQSIFWKDRDGVYLGCNEIFARQAGFARPEEIVGKTDFDLPWERRQTEKYRADDREVIALNRPKPHIIETQRQADGRQAWVDTTKIPLTDETGRVYGVLGVYEDISERVQAEAVQDKLRAQLVQAQKMESIGQLAGGVAHDFNNMLSVILGNAELALMKLDQAQPHFSALQEIRRAAERSANLTRQLLAFARKQTVAPRVIDLNETVEGMLKMLRRLIGEDIDLIWRPAAELWPIRIDPSQIDQILANLAVNARDAIDGVGRVIIETKRAVVDEGYCAAFPGFVPGEYVLLALSDNGCGMDRETQDKLFEPFFTTKETGKGTGLGMSTVYGIVKQNCGFIHVCSEPGVGTTFKLYLPRDRDEVEPARTEILPEPAAPPGHETILVVEDVPGILDITARLLRGQGYTVLTAAAPGEAIGLAERRGGGIDLLITDVIMPEMNGRELAGRLLALDPNLRCLFMSGYPAEVIAHHGVLDAGVNFIQKPFALHDMARMVREVLAEAGGRDLRACPQIT